MLTTLVLSAMLAPLALAAPAPAKRDHPLTCHKLHGGKDLSGHLDFYANITAKIGDKETFSETRLSVSKDIVVAGASSGVFGFEMCEYDGMGYEGQKNTPKVMYGHVLYYPSINSTEEERKCVRAETLPDLGSRLAVTYCQYGYEHSAEGGYWRVDTSDPNNVKATLIDYSQKDWEDNTLGPNREIGRGDELVLEESKQAAGEGYFGFKSHVA